MFVHQMSPGLKILGLVLESPWMFEHRMPLAPNILGAGSLKGFGSWAVMFERSMFLALKVSEQVLGILKGFGM
jgi:hypothetical protein